MPSRISTSGRDAVLATDRELGLTARAFFRRPDVRGEVTATRLVEVDALGEEWPAGGGARRARLFGGATVLSTVVASFPRSV